MKKAPVFLTSLVIFTASATVAHALLIDRGYGLIYDAGLNITWLQDANYAATSGYTPLFNPNNPGALLRNQQADPWVDSLVYAGYDDWRLPTTLQPDDPSCSEHDVLWSHGFNCTGSEMGHLYYTELGNLAGGPLTNTGPFTNMQDGLYYWFGNDFPSDGDDLGYSFDFHSGLQDYLNESGLPKYVWPVRDGDVRSVHEPASIWLIGVGLVGVMLARLTQLRRQKPVTGHRFHAFQRTGPRPASCRGCLENRLTALRMLWTIEKSLKNGAPGVN